MVLFTKQGTSGLLISCILLFGHAQAGIFSNRASNDDSSSSSNNNNNNNGGGATKENSVVTQKMDYKLSFKIPYVYNGTIPFWSTGGDTITALDRIRISPSVPGTKGRIWSDLENDYEEWMVDMSFSVSGNHLHGGRGMAFWYTQDKLPEGPIFGAKDQWKGLSIWFDSADPKTHAPSIMAFLNDGQFSFASAGVDPTKQALATCAIDYRNSNGYVKMRLTYKNRVLTLLLDPTSRGKNYRPCFRYTDIDLPTGYHFGLTAASHNPADDHDVLSFETYQLNPPQKKMDHKRPLEEEKIKKGEEFQGLTAEQLKKIEETEYEIRRLREQSNEAPIEIEAAATMGVLFDTERRILETLQVTQLQIEALGAPTSQQVLSGSFVPKPAAGKQEAGGISADHLRTETQMILKRLEQQSNHNDQQLRTLKDTMSKMETLLQAMDNRMALQTNNLQGKLSEITKDSAEAKGTMSTLIKYILYACGLQGVVGLAIYLYWKLRVEKNEKKFL